MQKLVNMKPGGRVLRVSSYTVYKRIYNKSISKLSIMYSLSHLSSIKLN